MTNTRHKAKQSDGYSLAYSRMLFDYLQSRHVDAAAVLGQAPPTCDGYTLTRIARTEWCAMLTRAARALDDPLFSLHLGQCITPNHLGVLGYILLSCVNVAALHQRWQQYERLVHDLTPLRSHSTEGSFLLEWPTNNDKIYAIADETALAAQFQFLRNATGKEILAEEVCFRHPVPADPRPYDEFFGCPVRFGQPYVSVRIPLVVLDLPLRQADAALLNMMELQAAALLDKLQDPNDLIRAVRACIAKHARESELGIERVASSLNLSTRTLHRRLAQEGWNFRDLCNNTKRELAEAYLRDSTLTLSEVGWLLGYSEHSAFTRAFKQWTGVAPRFWKEKAGGR